MCTLDGPSVLVADGLGLGASRPRLHNAPSHACHADRRVARVRAIVYYYNIIVQGGSCIQFCKHSNFLEHAYSLGTDSQG